MCEVVDIYAYIFFGQPTCAISARQKERPASSQQQVRCIRSCNTKSPVGWVVVHIWGIHSINIDIIDIQKVNTHRPSKTIL
jgi:hypothetical protein